MGQPTSCFRWLFHKDGGCCSASTNCVYTGATLLAQMFPCSVFLRFHSHTMLRLDMCAIFGTCMETSPIQGSIQRKDERRYSYLLEVIFVGFFHIYISMFLEKDNIIFFSWVRCLLNVEDDIFICSLVFVSLQEKCCDVGCHYVHFFRFFTFFVCYTLLVCHLFHVTDDLIAVASQKATGGVTP